MPYHVAFKEFLEPMAKDLREAAALSDDPAFAKFLRLRADALLTDDYYASDIAWLDLENPKFDVVFAPYEVYDDSLLGVKTTYGASVMIRNDAESQKLALYQKYVPDLQEALPLPAADLPSKRGKQSPMEVVDSPYRAGRSCCTDIRPSRTIFPTIRASTKPKARRKSSGRISWTRA